MSFLGFLLQEGSTNSSPIFSSGENSFDKSKLVVRKLKPAFLNMRNVLHVHFLILLHLN